MNKKASETLKARIYSRDEHCVSRKNIDPDALKILRRLIRHGYKAFLVGGSVRDLLLDKKPKDYDIATDARPKKIKALFRNCRIIGRRFKLAHIYFRGGKIIEVSTFRDSQELVDSCDALQKEDLLITRDNVYGDEKSDAIRRDLTINALFYALRNFSIIDYVGGMEDLKNKVTRVIGDPDIRFAEDPVRMLRVARHAARAEFEVEQCSAEAIVRNHELLLKSSQVRVYEELKRDLTSGYCFKICQLLAKFKLLQHLLPELASDDSIFVSEDNWVTRYWQNADRIIFEKQLVSATPVLSLLALFAQYKDQAQPDEPLLSACVSSPEEIEDCVKNRFLKLSVPRKERERIIRIMILALEVLQTPHDKMKYCGILRSSHFSDVFSLLEFLDIDHQRTETFDLLVSLRNQSVDRQGRKRKRGKRGRFPAQRAKRRMPRNIKL